MAEFVIRVDKELASKALRGLLTAALFFSAVPELASESVTLTTYYPAPSGVYAQMITTGNTFLARDGGVVGMGTVTSGMTNGVAKAYISNPGAGVGLYVGNGAPFGQSQIEMDGPVQTHIWAAENGGQVFSVGTGGQTVIMGNTSIGTNAANNRLTVSGAADVSSNLTVGIPWVGNTTTVPNVQMEVANGGAVRVGSAFLSDGGNYYMHLANHEYYNSGGWVTDGQPGVLLQFAGQNMNVYKHDAGGNHTTLAVLDANGSLNTYGGYIRAGSSLVSPLGCWAINMTLNGYATGWNGGCPGGNYVTLQSGVYSIYVAVPFPYASNYNYQQQYLDALCCPCPVGGCQF